MQNIQNHKPKSDNKNAVLNFKGGVFLYKCLCYGLCSGRFIGRKLWKQSQIIYFTVGKNIRKENFLISLFRFRRGQLTTPILSSEVKKLRL